MPLSNADERLSDMSIPASECHNTIDLLAGPHHFHFPHETQSLVAHVITPCFLRLISASNRNLSNKTP